MPNRIKELRETLKIKQVELANYLNVSQGTLSNWERCVHDPDNESLIRMAEKFNVTTDYILGRTESSNPSQKEKAPSTFEGLDLEEDRAYFSVMAKAKRDGFSAKDIEAITEVLRIAKRREEEAEAESE